MDLEPYRSAWRERFRSAEEARCKRADEARGLLPALVDHLVRGFGVRRVWVFGSLIEGGFHEGSDIDLAVEGMSPGAALFRAGVELEGLASGFRVDLVPLEEARAAVRSSILERGELLHDS